MIPSRRLKTVSRDQNEPDLVNASGGIASKSGGRLLILCMKTSKTEPVSSPSSCLGNSPRALLFLAWPPRLSSQKLSMPRQINQPPSIVGGKKKTFLEASGRKPGVTGVLAVVDPVLLPTSALKTLYASLSRGPGWEPNHPRRDAIKRDQATICYAMASAPPV